MPRSLADMRDLTRSPGGRKIIRYAMVSVVSVACSQLTTFVLFYVLRKSHVTSNVVGTAAGAVPSYYLNRAWVWGKRGRSHVVKEILPFWALVFVSLGLATLAGRIAEAVSRTYIDGRLLQSVFLLATNLGVFGMLWLLKFFVLNRFLFVVGSDHEEPSDDDHEDAPVLPA